MRIESKTIFNSINRPLPQYNNKIKLFCYHGDHLGSSSWITDASGNACTEWSRSVNQYLAYMPLRPTQGIAFGESFIDQRATEHDIRFKFTGKERDAETGFDYFGARYYDSDISVWLSVDPLSDMYPSTSPYMYTAGNPVMLVDPDGRNANPIFDESGELLGTDSEGWKGEAIVMKKDDFKQGMEHSKAEDKGTYLSKYGKGIKITDESWDKVEENGGERMTPYVQNNSNETVYYKPETDNGKYKNEGAYPIAPNTDLYAPVDGVKTKKTEKNKVHKLPTGFSVTINNNGEADINWFLDSAPGPYGEVEAPDKTWYNLRDCFKNKK